MGFWSGLCSCVSSVCRTVCSAIGSVGRGALSLVKGCAIGVGKIVGGIWGGIGRMLGVLAPQEQPEEIGERAFQGAEQGIKPEQFKTNQEYIQALRDKVKFDREKFNKLSEEEMHERRMLGTKITAKGIEEHLNIAPIPNNFLVTTGLLGLSIGQTLKLLETTKDKKVSLDDITDYLKERCKGEKIQEADEAIKTAISADNPSLSKEQVNQFVLDAQAKLRGEELNIPEEEKIEE